MKTLVLIPTYNERENLPLLVADVLAVPGTEILVIDDQSPDGTGRLAEELAVRHPGRLGVMHRKGRRGLGVSYLDGFKHAVASDADLVVGSRYLHGISVVNWPLRRIILSSFANVYIRWVTGLGVNDCTTGYRCWRREALAKLPLDRIVSEGYSFVVEVTFLAAVYGLRIAESPIIFIERREGASKLSSGILFESLITPWRLVFRHGRVRAAGGGSRTAGYNSTGAPQ